MNATRKMTLVALLVLGGVLGFGTVSASATVNYGLSFSFSSPEGFTKLGGLTVDQSDGDVYVADTGANALEKFSVTGGVAKLLWKTEVLPGAGLVNPTVDEVPGPDHGDIFVAGSENGVVYMFNSEGKELPSPLEGVPTVDDVAFAPNGDFYVLTYDRGALLYNSNWLAIDASGKANLQNEPLVESAEGRSLIVSPDGEHEWVWVAFHGGRVLGYHKDRYLGVFAEGAGGDLAFVQSGSGNFFEDIGIEVAEEEPSPEPVEHWPAAHAVRKFGSGVLSGEPAGIGVYGAGGPLYIGNSGTDTVDVFEEGATPPVPLTTGAKEDRSKVTLEGELRGDESGYYFAYNTGTNCEGQATTIKPATGIVSVSAEVEGLAPSTNYAYCLVAVNKYGGTVGAARTFESQAFEAVTEPATKITTSSAKLNGALNIHGGETVDYYFEYGPDGEYGSRTTEEEATVPAVSGEARVNATIENLGPAQVYHYRLVAKSTKTAESWTGQDRAVETDVNAPSEVQTTQASEVKVRSALLNGELNPGGVTKYYFEYGTHPCETVTHTCGQRTPEQEARGTTLQPVGAAEITSLAPATTYYYWIVAQNGGGAFPVNGPIYGQQQTFTTSSKPLVQPTISAETVTGVIYNAATFTAQVNPQDFASSYYVEYGTTSAYGARTASANISEGEVEVPVSIRLENLVSRTEYHARLVAENEAGVERGADIAFTTPPPGINGLPDDRTYEMVTPVDKEDAEIYIPDTETIVTEREGLLTNRLNDVAADGNAVVYQGDPTHSGGGESSGNGLGSAYLATHLAGGGWSQTSIQPAGRRLTFYQGFSSDLSIGVVVTPTEDTSRAESQLPGGHSPSCVGIKVESREEGTECWDDLYRHSFDTETYQPLFSATPLRAVGNFGGVVPWNVPESNHPYPVYAGGSADMSQLLFEANDALAEGEGSIEKELREDVKQEIEVEGRANYAYLYDWSEAGPTLVDVSPEGRVTRNATFGAPHAEGVSGSANAPNFSHAISSDGSRVFWTALEGQGQKQTPKALYVRENPNRPQSPLNAQDECTVAEDACTVQIDKEVGGEGRFWTASSDGSKVLFTSKAGELYEYQVNSVVGQPGLLTVLTPGVEVQGVLGASENLDYIYYVDGAGELHMLHYSGNQWEVPTSIATLSPEDGVAVQHPNYITNGFSPDIGDWTADIGTRTAEVSSDGQGLAFVSNQRLKTQSSPEGYENDGQDEVYVYSAASKSLFCASCSQGSEPGTSGFLPVSWSATYAPTLVSEKGNRVFFDSPSSLVPTDTNGLKDAYEWEREGVGTCAPGEGVRGGCVYLLSGGSGTTESELIGASVDGGDVFMVTRANLTPDAQDELYKVFDARVGGVKPPSPPECSGTGCQGIPGAPPTFATPSSVTFGGVGNFPPPSVAAPAAKAKPKSLTRAQKLAKALKLCRRKPQKQRASCEAKARKSYGPQSRAKRSSGAKRRSK
jgi:hypothetical protein